MIKIIKRLFVATLLSWSMMGVSQAAMDEVTFSDIVDGDGLSSLFDVDATAVDLSDGNKLIIGLNNFSANGDSILTYSAVDTLTMTIDAPSGYFITSVSYTEGGDGQTENGVATATGALVADSTPINFLTQIFAPNADSGWTITPATILIDNKTSIVVSITNSLFAFAFAPGEIAQITKTSATLTIGVEPVPLPAAVWLFGSTLIGFVAFGRRRLS
ncbi:MAG: VPLPA-CTERM sorting domain-containing protein [Gammaproteobacteria bacterium]|nr:VPLPA-CTERM sorting domain-containing protein [Gammaproteobacteria bacterium]